MADVGIIEGEKLLIQIGNDASPEVFLHPCLINTTRGIDFTTNLTETEVADCTDQSLPAKIIRKAKSIDFTVSGAGKTDRTTLFEYIQWWQSGVAKNAKITQLGSGATGGWVGTGSLIIQNMGNTGDRGDYQDFTISLVPASPFTWTAAA
ncbi:MAG TPA: phage tail tube protein [Asticcacaulis sp.]|nr:phage tail tube protein [Asticcacaulis sp.]